MKRAILIYITFIISVVYNFLPGADPDPKIDSRVSWFIFSSDKYLPKSYVYFFNEHLILIILTYIVYVESKRYQLFFKFAFWCQIVDLFDWFLTNNNVWYNFHGFPMSMNVLSGIVLGLALLNEWIWDGHRDLN